MRTTGASILAIGAGLAVALLAGVPGGLAQEECLADRVVADGDADGLVSTGDVFLSPPDGVGEVPADDPASGRPLPALPGTLSVFDLDADGKPSKGDVATWDRAPAGRSVGDLLLGDLATSGGTLRFGTVLRAGDPGPPAAFVPYPGGALAFFDESGDGTRNPGEALYGAAGAAVAPNDVRLEVEGHVRGTLVRSADHDSGFSLTAGPILAYLDEDGSGSFNVPACAASTSSAQSSPPAGPSSGPASSTTESGTAPPSVPHGDPCEAFGGPCGTESTPAGDQGAPLLGTSALLAVTGALLVAARRRFR
jgi:hypothetical protein